MAPQDPVERELVVISERVKALSDRFNDHVAMDNAFQQQITSMHVEVQRTLKAIELQLSGWRGIAIAAVAAVSAVWAITVVAISIWKSWHG